MIAGGRLALVGMAAAGLIGAGFGMKYGHDLGERRGAKMVIDVRRASEKVITAKLGEIRTLTLERDQARAEVAKVNAETARQYAELKTLLTADADARAAAAVKVEAAATKAAKEAKLAGERVLLAKEVIQNVADACARAGVPDDVVRMLDSILAASPSP